MVMVESMWEIYGYLLKFLLTALCLKIFAVKCCIKSDKVRHVNHDSDLIDCSFYQFFFLSTVLKWEYSLCIIKTFIKTFV